MILVDSSVWIDVLADRETPQTLRFHDFLARRVRLGVADLIVTEVLQGIRSERVFRETLETLVGFPSVVVGSLPVAIEAARNYRTLRSHGATPRKTADTLIATRCILDDFPLLFSDQDFLPFVQHLGLRSAMDFDTGET